MGPELGIRWEEVWYQLGVDYKDTGHGGFDWVCA